MARVAQSGKLWMDHLAADLLAQDIKRRRSGLKDHTVKFPQRKAVLLYGGNIIAQITEIQISDVVLQVVGRRLQDTLVEHLRSILRKTEFGEKGSDVI